MQACRAKRDVAHCPLGLGFRNWAARVMACLWSDTRLLALTWPRHNDAGSRLGDRAPPHVFREARPPDCGCASRAGPVSSRLRGPPLRGEVVNAAGSVLVSHAQTVSAGHTQTREGVHHDFRGKLALSVPLGHSVWANLPPFICF